MRVTVRMFARLRELAGREAWPCEVPPGATVADVWRAVVAVHPAVAAFDRAVSCAVNAEFAKMPAPVHEGDDVAFLPPVSGG
jgi:molybdopterin converting factor subunit 1